MGRAPGGKGKVADGKMEWGRDAAIHLSPVCTRQPVQPHTRTSGTKRSSSRCIRDACTIMETWIGALKIKLKPPVHHVPEPGIIIALRTKPV